MIENYKHLDVEKAHSKNLRLFLIEKIGKFSNFLRIVGENTKRQSMDLVINIFGSYNCLNSIWY